VIGRTPEDVRARVPALAAVYEQTRATVLEDGIVDPEIKALCARYLAEGFGIEGFDGRERAALDWAHAVAWDATRADDDLWARLHANFSEPELVELGYFVAFTLGQTHWLRTLGLDPANDCGNVGQRGDP
jgi:alkylhydroperoxidase family enzyme